MSRDEHHVVYDSDKKCWNIKRNGTRRVSATADSKHDAVCVGRKISRNQNTELIIHLKNGKIQNSDSHGNDPCPPRDRK